MTTILGVRTNKDDERAIILGADRQLNYYEGDQHTEKAEIEKILKFKNNDAIYAIASVGPEDKDVNAFFTYLQRGIANFEKFLKAISKGQHTGPFAVYASLLKIRQDFERIQKKKIDLTVWESKFLQYIENKYRPKTEFTKNLMDLVQDIFKRREDPVFQALTSGYFLELDLLNRIYFSKHKKERPFVSEATELIIASNKPKLGLFYVDFQGTVSASDNDDKMLEYFCLGSGSVFSEEYFENNEFDDDKNIKDIKKKLKVDKISFADVGLSEAVCLAYGALKKAVLKDPDSSEKIDLIIVDKGGFFDLGKHIEERKKEVEKEALIEGINKYFNKKSKKSKK
ncbi:hypothetical protein DRJ22_05565 [Candidatus Woesearchaeota archaeon]|nr:MAG: hypothetical protein B6U93_03075 [Candidatus Woesearchaeota archaeon ex4484_78]RLE44718.1 MAG: hypothetical protein DRJ22_05565 [Candidatus Woesearchaeota archaeon]